MPTASVYVAYGPKLFFHWYKLYISRVVTLITVESTDVWIQYISAVRP